MIGWCYTKKIKRLKKNSLSNFELKEKVKEMRVIKEDFENKLMMGNESLS